jgi:hypothetical protein|tara:strand:- start:639 stop:1223 length:585 start_codon:yes stop_codon:yes gene_type:complete
MTFDGDRWAHLGHKRGECYADTDQGITYVHIPKNASSFIKGCLLGSQKFTYSLSLVKNNRYLVVLRDPIDRWVSGMAEYESNSKQTNIAYQQITFDDHTETQWYFLDGVILDQCDFIMINDSFKDNLAHWFNEQGYITDINNATKSNSSQGTAKESLKSKYQAIVDTVPAFVLKLKKHFADDYALINRVKFYGN